jgi:cytochrome c oxidase cbb3-type subunit 3
MIRIKRRCTAALSAMALLAPLAACDAPPGDSSAAPDANDVPALVAGTYHPLADEGLAQGTAVVPATELVAGGVSITPDMANPYGNGPDVLAAGRRHFAAFNCSGCHAALGGGGMGPALSDDDWIYGAAPAQVYLSILHGRPEGMPAWGTMLPDRTIWELVAYVRSLHGITNPAEHEGFQRHPPPDFQASAALP